MVNLLKQLQPEQHIDDEVKNKLSLEYIELQEIAKRFERPDIFANSEQSTQRIDAENNSGGVATAISRNAQVGNY